MIVYERTEESTPLCGVFAWAICAMPYDNVKV